jgi:hypothetical protein
MNRQAWGAATARGPRRPEAPRFCLAQEPAISRHRYGAAARHLRIDALWREPAGAAATDVPRVPEQL